MDLETTSVLVTTEDLEKGGVYPAELRAPFLLLQRLHGFRGGVRDNVRSLLEETEHCGYWGQLNADWCVRVCAGGTAGEGSYTASTATFYSIHSYIILSL